MTDPYSFENDAQKSNLKNILTILKFNMGKQLKRQFMTEFYNLLIMQYF